MGSGMVHSRLLDHWRRSAVKGEGIDSHSGCYTHTYKYLEKQALLFGVGKCIAPCMNP